MPDRIVLSTMGSLGDLHPFIAIALRLKERGYDPVIATGPNFRENVTAAGINFHPVGPSPEDLYRDLRMDAGEFGRRVMQDTLFILHGATFPYLSVMYDELLPVIDGAALVLTSSLVFSARWAAEKLGVPQMGVALQPMIFLSAYDPPHLDPARWLAPVLSFLGPAPARAVLGAAKKLVARQANTLYTFRRQLGLPETDLNPLYEGQFSSHGTLAMYSKHLGRVQPDYPPHTAITGFTFYDGSAQRRPDVPADLEAFLASGPPPLVFALGSFAVGFAGDFYQVSVDVARHLEQRAVLLVGARGCESYRPLAGADVFIGDYAPFSRVFPHARAIIHQGGIGTLGQALRAGKPQLVVPFLADQYDNAARVVRLGVARTVVRKRYRSSRVTEELMALLDNASYAAHAAAVGGEISREDGAEEAARLVERLLRSLPGDAPTALRYG
jgi:rhamnosyltransferase subunit B